jgi:hypothetical protein
MRGRFEFARSVEANGLRTYTYVAADTRLFERTWTGLDRPWPEFGPNPFSVFAVNGNNREELAVYLGLIWRLTEGLLPFVVPRFHREAGMYEAGEPYALVSWEYDVDSRHIDRLGRIGGFQPARSSVRIHPPPGPWEREHAGHAGLFEVPLFSILAGIMGRLLGDVTADLNVYALSGSPSVDRLVEALRSPKEPLLAECLSADDMFINLSVQVDLEYGDSLVIQALHDLDEELSAIVSEYEHAVEAYEAQVDQITSTEEFISRMWDLVGLKRDHDTSRFLGW